jgi:hypothetical protein
MIRLLSALFLVLSLGCATEETAIISDGEQSLAEIKKAIIAVIGEPRKVSENQREFTSQYFSKKEDPNFDPLKSKTRLFTTMAILGPRRPYDIEIRAFVEVKIKGSYEQDGEDSETAQKLAKLIQEKLNQSREGRNLIDDFRAF